MPQNDPPWHTTAWLAQQASAALRARLPLLDEPLREQVQALLDDRERLLRETRALNAHAEHLHTGLTAAHAAIGRVEEVADWGVPVSPGTIRRALDCSQSLDADERAAADAVQGARDGAA